MVKSNLLAEFAVSKDRLIQALACVSNLADRAVVQAIVHPKDTILGFAFSNTLINGESGDQIYAYYIIVQEEMMGAKFMVNEKSGRFSISHVLSSSSTPLLLGAQRQSIPNR